MADRRKTMIERVEDIGDVTSPSAPDIPLEDPSILDEPAPLPQEGAGSEVMHIASTSTGKPSSGIEQRHASAAATPLTTKKSPQGDLDCEVYRPTNRPPMALLHVLDDGSRTVGQSVRLRGDRLVIGREEGNITVDHDGEMSGTHAEIVREISTGRFRWLLRDLKSTNGTFVRVFNGPLKQDQEVMIGSRRYRFQDAQLTVQTETASAADGSHQRNATKGWHALSSDDLGNMLPSFVELKPTGESGQRLRLGKESTTIGSDSERCSLVIEDDPFVSGVHAEVSRRASGRWVIKDANSVNGVWLRISALHMDTRCEFQLGEQRFLFMPPQSIG